MSPLQHDPRRGDLSNRPQQAIRAGVTDPAERAKLRAELDGIIAHIYGLTEDEFAYVPSTFPLVAAPVKAAALAAYRDL